MTNRKWISILLTLSMALASLPVMADTESNTAVDTSALTALPTPSAAPSLPQTEAEPEADLTTEPPSTDSPEHAELAISGITVADKAYDAQPAAYTGTPVLTDGEGNVIDVPAENYIYVWKDAEDNILESAPVAAGAYKLVVSIADTNETYGGISATIDFTISKKDVTVKPKDVNTTDNDQVPKLGLEVTGLLAADLAELNTVISKAAMKIYITKIVEPEEEDSAENEEVENPEETEDLVNAEEPETSGEEIYTENPEDSDISSLEENDNPEQVTVSMEEIPLLQAIRTVGTYTIRWENQDDFTAAFANLAGAENYNLTCADTAVLTVVKKQYGNGGLGIATFTVKFNSAGGSEVESQRVTQNKLAKEPKAPVKEGYTFTGWYTSSSLKTEYDFSEPVKASMTLFAGWEKADAENTVESAYSENSIYLNVDSHTAYVWGEEKYLDVPPVIQNDRVMLPSRFVAENLGASVSWDPSGVVTIVKGDVKIVLTIGSYTAVTNEGVVSLDSPACIKDDRTLTPLRFIAERLGADVEWVEETRTVIITK